MGVIGALVAGFIAGLLVGSGSTQAPHGASVASPSARPSPQSSVPGIAPPQTPAATPLPADGLTSFDLSPAPPTGYEGQFTILRAAGVGSQTTPPFHVTRGALSGNMEQSGPTTSFFIVPVGARFDPSATPPVAGCSKACDGGWSARRQPGDYRLVVMAPSHSRWGFGIDDSATVPLVVTVIATPPARASGPVTVLTARGLGNQQTKVFHLFGGSLIGGMLNGGSYSYFYLVPAGRQFDRTAKPTAACDDNCASGGWAAQVTPGDYYLAVVADDSWSFDIQVVRP